MIMIPVTPSTWRFLCDLPILFFSVSFSGVHDSPRGDRAEQSKHLWARTRTLSAGRQRRRVSTFHVSM